MRGNTPRTSIWPDPTQLNHVISSQCGTFSVSQTTRTMTSRELSRNHGSPRDVVPHQRIDCLAASSIPANNPAADNTSKDACRVARVVDTRAISANVGYQLSKVK